MMDNLSVHSKNAAFLNRTPRLEYMNKVSTIENLTKKEEAVKIHIRKLQILITEIFKVKNGTATKLKSDTF